jgi:hypothetical protein
MLKLKLPLKAQEDSALWPKKQNWLGSRAKQLNVPAKNFLQKRFLSDLRQKLYFEIYQ